MKFLCHRGGKERLTRGSVAFIPSKEGKRHFQDGSVRGKGWGGMGVGFYRESAWAWCAPSKKLARSGQVELQFSAATKGKRGNGVKLAKL